ncbi:MAG: hypothetical protein GF417_02655 [Candidatus Latescibacteria bacterium]|nr:hypothetical protein [bacterium]MBD3423330.1 hypothetical protein [Candidatus Latescibacterota bacterium]
MSTRVILIIIFLAALLLLALIILLERKKKREPEERGYIKALYSLIEGNRYGALAYLKQAVRNGERDVGAYILLGDLLRKEGKPEKALQVHRNMSVRRDLTEDNRREIQLAISRDLLALKRNEEAISTIENIRKWKNYPDIVFTLHRFYHLNGEYRKAHSTLKRYVKLDNAVGNEMIVSYLTSVATGFIKMGDFEMGAEYSEKALEIKGLFTPALYSAGFAYYREDDNDRAIEKWLLLLKTDISYLSLTLNYIEKMLFEQKDFGRLETVLKDLYEENKGNPELFRALASFYQRKGEISRIIEYFESEINQIVLDDKLIIMMAGIYLNEGKDERASEILNKSATRRAPERRYKCEECGAVSISELSYCANCGGINSFQEYYEDRTA